MARKASAGPFQSIIDDYKKGRGAANEANQQRYDQLIALLRGVRTQAANQQSTIASEITGRQQAANAQIANEAEASVARKEQDLAARGLGQAASTLDTGVAADAALVQQGQEEIARSEAINNLLTGVSNDISTTGSLGAAIEGRNDVGPDMAQYAQLLRAATEQGAFGGAGGMGGGGSVANGGKRVLKVGWQSSSPGFDSLGRPSIFSRSKARNFSGGGGSTSGGGGSSGVRTFTRPR